MPNPFVEALEGRWLLSHARPPAGPTGLVATAQTPASIAIVYVDRSTNETAFHLERSTFGAPFVLIGVYPASRGTGLHGIYDRSVSPGTTYAYRIQAVNRAGGSAYAGPVGASTPGRPVPSPPPPVTPPPPTARNLLFFGNSFTLFNDVPLIVSDLAVADGHPQPHVFTQATFGWTLADHLHKIAADGANNIISHSLPPGRKWDDVIVQEFSTRSTSVTHPPVNGDSAAFRADAAHLFNLVRAQSPTAHDVLEETWARGPANPIYPTGYTTPFAMQNDLLANYNGAAFEANAAHGSDAASVAPVGEAWRAENFAANLYNGPDEYHPSQRGSVLAALVIFRTTYGEKTAVIPPANVATLLSTEGLSAADWKQLTAVADGV